MDEERRRILRMMAEGTISVEECDELLRALSDRRREKTEKDVQAVQDKRPVWPYVLLVVLAIVALPVGLATFAGLLGGTVWRFGPMPGFRSWLPCIFLLAPIRILLFVFWLWMVVDCLSRLPCDFRLLFTTEHRYEKWIWLGIVILVCPIGAIVYFFLIRQPGKQIAPPSTKEKAPSAPKPPVPSERPLRPSRRARSIKGLVIISIIIIFTILISAVILSYSQRSTTATVIFPQNRLGVQHWVSDRPVLAYGKDWLTISMFISPLAIIVLIWLIFWICMLIDCLARDYREFGTLITSDKSADKLVWLLLILFTFIIGAIAYHISVRRRPIAA